jgi:hypothetical protein
MPKPKKVIKQNDIVCCYTNDGIPCEFDMCNYVEIKLNGPHAELEDAHMLISKNKLQFVIDFVWYLGKGGYPITHQSVDGDVKFSAGLKVYKLLHPNVEKGMIVDHINRNRLDNRDNNLRICTAAENSYNKTKNIKSKNKFKGVSKSGNTWTASITKDGKQRKMTGLPDEETAAKMYDIMAEELFGIYAAKNFE